MEWKSTPAAIWAAALWYTLLGGFLAAFAFWQSLTAGIAFAAVWLLLGLWLLLVVLPIVAFYVLKNKSMGESENTGTRSQKALYAIAMGAGLVIGIYDGIYGPGTGTFLLLILTGLGRMDLKSAAGTTKVINLSSNVAALVTFIFHGQIYWPLGLAASVFSIAGHYTGAGLVAKDGKKIVRPVVLTVLCILFVKVIVGF